MIRYKAGFKYVDGGVHAQVLDFPAAISCGADLAEARRLLTIALLEVAEMETTAEAFDAARAAQPLSRDELLRRQAQAAESLVFDPNTY